MRTVCPGDDVRESVCASQLADAFYQWQALKSGSKLQRTYSSTKVIHRGRRGAFLPPPQPSVNNFGGDVKFGCEQLSLWLNRRVGHAGSGRRISHSNVATFFWRASLRGPAPGRQGILRTLRLPSTNLAETNLYKCFPPTGTACPTLS